MTNLIRPTRKVLPGDGRSHNRAVILQHLFHSGQTTRSALVTATGLTRVTVADLLRSLIAEDLVEELEAAPEGRVGKPSTRVRLRSEGFHIVAMDLTDDDNVHGAVLDLSGAVLERKASPATGLRGEDALRTAGELADDLVRAATAPVLGIGVSSPGVISADGTVLEAPNRGWYDVHLATDLQKRLRLPVHVANDADVAVLGEVAYGGANPESVMAVRVGQGVGAGLIVGGSLIRGTGYAAGEVGHLTVVDERDGDVEDPFRLGPPLRCACGRSGCLETVLALPALRARLEGLAESSREAALQAVGRRVGIAFGPVVAALDLDEIVFIGGGELLEGTFAETVLATLRHRTMPVSSADLVVRTSTLGENSGLLGSAGLVLSGELGFS